MEEDEVEVVGLAVALEAGRVLEVDAGPVGAEASFEGRSRRRSW